MDENMVEETEACPECGERHMDNLVWLDDDRVKCTACGHSYNPETGEAYFE
jgi:rubredoxin